MSAPAVAEHDLGNLGYPNRKLGFWIFLGSECMLFGALIGAYMSYVGKSLVGPYPADLFDIGITTWSTFTLLMSSFTMVLALHYVRQGSRRLGGLWLAATALGGLIFLGFQSFEFTHFYHAGLSLQKNLFGTTFFVLTGFHGAHVSGGVLWLTSLFVMNARGLLGPEKALDVEICGLYWHFVDIVWIVLFTVVYLLEFAK
jgi:heme/copper-type cytochrome/quinol oxidase subunit 3